jgi:hypothetical protein
MVSNNKSKNFQGKGSRKEGRSKRRAILNAIATPLPVICSSGAVIQKAVVHPLRKKTLQTGTEAKNIGHTKRHPRSTPPVPYLCCKIGKAKSSHMAWLMPIPIRKSDICRGEKP